MERISLSQASKKLRKLQEDYDFTRKIENDTCEYVIAQGENESEAKPYYDFVDTAKTLTTLDKKIRKLKHQINLANATTIVDDFDMTIDELLVYIPQLTKLKNKYAHMCSKPSRMRRKDNLRGSNLIEYTCLNYDPVDAKKFYEETSDTLSRAQLLLDQTNCNTFIEVD